MCALLCMHPCGDGRVPNTSSLPHFISTHTALRWACANVRIHPFDASSFAPTGAHCALLCMLPRGDGRVPNTSLLPHFILTHQALRCACANARIFHFDASNFALGLRLRRQCAHYSACIHVEMGESQTLPRCRISSRRIQLCAGLAPMCAYILLTHPALRLRAHIAHCSVCFPVEMGESQTLPCCRISS